MGPDTHQQFAIRCVFTKTRHAVGEGVRRKLRKLAHHRAFRQRFDWFKGLPVEPAEFSELFESSKKKNDLDIVAITLAVDTSPQVSQVNDRMEDKFQGD